MRARRTVRTSCDAKRPTTANIRESAGLYTGTYLAIPRVE
jgi:hypothetical protein